ncbi:polyphosphate:AMP phosphotransferase [Synoicihabitans lomoniglobus]|uniref:Polyphosphate:AMP phosphotransferase n=1 Tax=Synoicihabitans lomoniglobus TaxID=2909285 RepID=A0AAF0CNA3_9BACT|nr:polyphosphate:AMP phosphotransferase [Opitutaceae bacterium LMO-M01]WED64341.1 polyphosphate:AMP phosphotransferase [Opitutaceae bacterium LMO-M01]
MASSTGDTEKLPKKIYDAQVATLREELVQLQVELKKTDFKIVLILAGVDGAGRGDAINTLMGWLDPRGVETIALQQPTDEERERPLMWRFWRGLPTSGRIGIFVGSWYTETLREEARSKKALAELDHELRRIRHFERLLSDNGTLVVKVWFHLSKAEQGRRLRAHLAHADTAWRVTDEQQRAHRIYNRLATTAEHILGETDRPGAHWDRIEAADPRARNVNFAGMLVRRFKEHHRRYTNKKHVSPTKPKRVVALRPDGRKRLLSLELDRKLSSKAYEAKREKWLGRLNRAVRRARDAKRSIVFVFEGQDAAGKGGAIRRLTGAIDARDYRVVPVAKPTDEEKAHHYLWRFWRQIPRDGFVAIFDRSWYGRVLVERVEGFCHPHEWRRAFEEINDFEEQLIDHGSIVVKFWLQVSKDEQLERFRAREETPYKQHKINDEDWRNRAQWSAYETAVGDMLALTDTAPAPWHLVPANNKRFARFDVLRHACKQITAALDA